MNPEAIEAAAMAIYANNGYDGSGFELGDYRSDARAALEAAAPYLIRDARAAELETAAEALDLPGSSATGYYSGNNDSGYLEAENHTEAWLRARAAAIRAGEAC